VTLNKASFNPPAALTDDERAILAAAEVIQRRVATDPEAQRLAAKAEYEAQIAERDARCNADPVYLAGLAESRRQELVERRREIERVNSLAHQDSGAISTQRIRRGDRPAWVCVECRVPVFEIARVGLAFSLCVPCWAQHRLRCDECKAHKDVLTRWCNDSKWRCDPCVEKYLANPPAEILRGRMAFLASAG
jgi:hypothetical protein